MHDPPRRTGGRPPSLARLAAATVASAALLGCTLIAKTDDFMVGAAESAPFDASMGASNGAPDACASDASTTCRAGTCLFTFDNVDRIAGFSPDASLPPLPDAGAEPLPDAGGNEGGVTEGGAHQGGGGGGGGGGRNGGGSDAAAGTEEGGGGGEAGVAGEAGDESEAGGGGMPGGPACSSLPQPVFVVGAGGLLSIGEQLGALTSMVPITVVYVSAHACDGANAVILNQSTLSFGVTTGTYWDVSGTAHTCQLDAGGNYADIGLTPLFPESCLTLPQGTPGVGDFLGPVIPEAMVVPILSTQTAISAEALYYTFGLGPGVVAPWTDPSFVFQNPTSTAQIDFGIAIGVPPTAWQGSLQSGSNQTVTAVVTSTQPEKTLTCMGTDLVESISRSSTLKELAYQDFGQSCAYYPNLTATSADKVNVRNGRYPVWGFTHMLTKVNAQNVPLSHNANQIILYFTGDAPTPTGNYLQFVIQDRLVPPCAMGVTRSSEMGPLSPYSPSPSCGCYFDSVATGSTTCRSCKTTTDCPAESPNCNLGFCEAH